MSEEIHVAEEQQLYTHFIFINAKYLNDLTLTNYILLIFFSNESKQSKSNAVKMMILDEHKEPYFHATK